MALRVGWGVGCFGLLNWCIRGGWLTIILLKLLRFRLLFVCLLCWYLAYCQGDACVGWLGWLWLVWGWYGDLGLVV